jgi:Tfp pilus assembly protein PilX
VHAGSAGVTEERLTTVRALLARRSADDGIAMIVSIALMGIVGVIVVALVGVALSEARGTGRDRQRSVAVMSAEGKVDSLVATIQSTAPALLPCGDLTAENQQVISDGLIVGATVTYYDAAGVEIDCSAVPTSTSITQAAISATTTSDAIAGTSSADRTVETLLRLTPFYDNQMDKAIFGDAGVEIGKDKGVNLTLSSAAADADVYSNGDFLCGKGNQQYQGSVYAQGDVDISGNCEVLGDAHAGGLVDASGNKSDVNGDAIAAGGSLVINGDLTGQGRASGSVGGTGCTAGKCTGGLTGLQPPPSEPFPMLRPTATSLAEWASEGGYNTVLYAPGDVACAPVAKTGAGKTSGDADGVASWVWQNGPLLTGNTIIVSTCPQTFYSKGLTLSFAQNLLVFSASGFDIQQNTTLQSTVPTQQRNVYFAEPGDSQCPSAAAGGITLDQLVTVTSSVALLLYSPCDIVKANHSDLIGQIYAGGTAEVSNNTDMAFIQLPVWGIEATSTVVAGYDVEILYKRENR